MRAHLRRATAVFTVVSALLASIICTYAAPASASSGAEFVNNGSKLCLGIHGSSLDSGAYAVQGTCGGTRTQLWNARASTVVGGLTAYQYMNDVGMCLGVQGGSQTSGAQVVQGNCGNTGDHSQFWWIFNNGDDTDTIENSHSALCLGIQGSSTASGAKVLQGTCSFTPTQAWYGLVLQ